MGLAWNLYISKYEISFKIGRNKRWLEWPDIIFRTFWCWCTFIADNHTLRFCYKVHDAVINRKQAFTEKNESKVLQNVVKKFFKYKDRFMLFFCIVWSFTSFLRFVAVRWIMIINFPSYKTIRRKFMRNDKMLKVQKLEMVYYLHSTTSLI